MPKKSLSFEEAQSRLEEIVKTLEENKASLNDSLSLFEEGAGLVALSNKMLDEAEQKVKILSEEKN